MCKIGPRSSNLIFCLGHFFRLNPILVFKPRCSSCQVVIGLDVAEAAFNPTPGDSNGVDQDLYEENGNDWIRLIGFAALEGACMETMNL